VTLISRSSAGQRDIARHTSNMPGPAKIVDVIASSRIRIGSRSQFGLRGAHCTLRVYSPVNRSMISRWNTANGAANRGPARPPRRSPGRKMSPDRTFTRFRPQSRGSSAAGARFRDDMAGTRSRTSPGQARALVFLTEDAGAQVRCAMSGSEICCAHLLRKTPKGAGACPESGCTSPGRVPARLEHMETPDRRAEAAVRELSAKTRARRLFAAGRKRPVPSLPRRIGVVTSPPAAAYGLLHVLARRFPAVAV